jgi:hypothetical protein
MKARCMTLRERSKLIVHLMSCDGVPQWLRHGCLPCLKHVAHWHDNSIVLCWSRNPHYRKFESWPNGAVCACSDSDDYARSLQRSIRLQAALPVFCFDCANKVWEPIVLLLPQGALAVVESCERPIFWIERKSWRETLVTPFEQRYFAPEKVCGPVELLLDFARYQIETTMMRFPPRLSDRIPWSGQFGDDSYQGWSP